ncbi:MAG: family 10 glycosylhydrolase [Bacteroidota bacterium]
MSDRSLSSSQKFLLTLPFIAALAAVAQPSSPPPPKREVRAVWLTTASGLDWPKTTDKNEQQSSLREIVKTLQRARFNTIFFQARARGDAYYRSAHEPWAENLTGTLGTDPGWDPLAFLIDEAHAAGIEVHAWINVFKIRGQGAVANSTPPHPARAHPGWTVNYAGEGWFDPGKPEVRAYLTGVIADLAGKYDLDGVNLDYCRYPGRDFSDAWTFYRYGNGAKIEEWRISNIDRFVADCYAQVHTLKPMMKVGASPLAISVIETDPSAGTLKEYAQDAKRWLKAGTLDYVSPQIYWDMNAPGGGPDFAVLVRAWLGAANGRHVYAGIGAYKPEVARQITAQIDTVRTAGGGGEVFFRYGSIRGMTALAARYENPAGIPPMAWKDSIPPLAPPHVGVSEVAANVFQLEWLQPPPARDGDRAHHYVYYRWPERRIPFDDARSVAGITPRNETLVLDTVVAPAGPTYYYAVTAVDKGSNEGPPSPTTDATTREFIALRGKLSEPTALSVSLPAGAHAPPLIAYSLSRPTNVELTLVSRPSRGQETVVASLARGVQQRGTYVVGMEGRLLGEGKYLVRLKAGEMMLEQEVK